jgi:hypothetical protein
MTSLKALDFTQKSPLAPVGTGTAIFCGQAQRQVRGTQMIMLETNENTNCSKIF